MLLVGCGSASHLQGLLPLSGPMWLSDKPTIILSPKSRVDSSSRVKVNVVWF